MNRLPACRVCLSYDTRLCSIMDAQFRDIYEKLVEASLEEDMLPTSVCYLCFSLMNKILQFRDRSLKSNQILQQIIIMGLEPSVSSLDLLVNAQTGISWNLGISDIVTTTTTSSEIELIETSVKIESVKSEIDIEETSEWHEDYCSVPVCRDFMSDSEDHFPVQNINEQCKPDQVKIVKTLKEPAPAEEQKFVKKKIVEIPEAEMTTINEEQFDGAFNNIDTVTPPKDTFTCDLCKNEYHCKSRLESHMKKSHVIEFSLKGSINSDLNISNEFESTNLLKLRESRNNDKWKNKRRENKLRDNTSQYECQYCKKRFAGNAMLTRHIRVHTKEKPFKCDACGKRFSEKSKLTRHLRVHTNETPFKCDICEKGFRLSHHLTRHLKVHTEDELFKCDICQKVFSAKCNLTVHLRVHTQEKPFKCDICEKGFSQSGNLTKHLRVHTKENPFKCQICDKSFSQSGNLAVHFKVHTKEKHFKCDICEKSFSRFDHLNLHLRVHSKETPFKCGICEKSFSRIDNLTRHLKVHT